MSFFWFGDGLLKGAKNKVLDGVEEWARADVMPTAKENCPVDHGNMRDSHTTQRKGKTVTVGVGGSSAPYALKQHEDMSLRHTVGEAKWLENAYNSMLPRLPGKIKGKF